MWRLDKTGAWETVAKLLREAPQRTHAAMDKAMLQEGHFLRTKIVEGIREQAPGGRAFAPLAATTLAIRKFRGFGGTKALIVHGDLRNNVTVTKDGDRVLVGVLRSAKGRDGKSLVNVAAAHELGTRPFAVKLTPKSRAFLHAAFRKAGLAARPGGGGSMGIAVVQVRARPFIGPVLEKYARPEDVSRRFLARVADLLNGDLGRV